MIEGWFFSRSSHGSPSKANIAKCSFLLNSIAGVCSSGCVGDVGDVEVESHVVVV